MTVDERTTLEPRLRQRGVRRLIQRRPIASYFVLANLLSWVAWTPYILSQNGLGVWDYTFPRILGTSQLLGMLPGAYFGPITSAVIVTAIASGRAGLRQWGRRLWKWRVNWRWYALAILGVPAAITLIGLAFAGGHVQAPSLMVLAALVPGLVLQLLTTGIAEEPGWRDFAVPRLQARYGALAGAFILGPLWALWHFPLFLTEWGGWPHADWTRPLTFTVFCVAFSIIMTWVFNRTGQSLPVAMLLHVSVNNFISIAWSDIFPTLGANVAQFALMVGSVIIATVLLVTTRGRLGYVPEALQ
ncbi:CPBP family intramembrane glutamic endopeptidase [Parafrigoribacterium soli]|uniref:CPBP family intramembrane glutamic endopeptidase n=1 Tax=Parafrigoribacterium soli TaxID=3144663 RepID=UPI0032EEE860